MEQRLCLLQSKSARERVCGDNVREAGKFTAGKMTGNIGLFMVLALVGWSSARAQEQGHVVKPDNNLGDDGELADTDVVLAFVVRSAN